jgi:hypothetical protein
MGVEPLKSTSPSQLQGPEYPYNNPHVRYVSNSEIQTFKDCRRKWWLAYYRGLTPKEHKFLGPLAIGGRIHRALQDWYVPDGEFKLDPRDAIELHIEADQNNVRQIYGDEPPEDFIKQFNKEADLERIMLEGYMQWLEETGADDNYDIIAPEEYIERSWTSTGFDNRRIVLIARLDVRMKRLSDGKIMFMDHKTLASIDTLSLVSDEQMLMYSMLISDKFGDIPGVLYNMLKKVRRSVKAKPPFFNRIEVSYNHHQIIAFINHLGRILKEITFVERRLALQNEPYNVPHDAVHHDIIYPRPTRDCVWKCDFYRVCSMFDDGSRVEDMLTERYKQVDPLAYYHDKGNDKQTE